MPSKQEVRAMFTPRERKPVVVEVVGLGKFRVLHPTVEDTGIPVTPDAVREFMQSPEQVSRLMSRCIVDANGGPVLTPEEATKFAETAPASLVARVVGVILGEG